MRLIKPGSEAAIQAAFFEWAALAANKYPELELFFSVPNGSNKSPAERIVHKATGLKSGVPDTFLPVPRSNWHGLFIEFKTEKGRLSDSQKWWIERLERQGFRAVVCREWTEAADLTLEYLGTVDQAPTDPGDLIWFDAGTSPVD